MSRNRKPQPNTSLPAPTVDLMDTERRSRADLLRRIGCTPYMAGLPPLEPYLSEAQWIALAKKVLEEDGPAQYFVNMFALLRPLAGAVQRMTTSAEVAEIAASTPEPLNILDITEKGFLFVFGFSGKDDLAAFVASLNLPEIALPTANVTIPRAGDRWTGEGVAGMLCNPIYAGVAPYPALVDEKTWISSAQITLKKVSIEQFFVNMLYALRVSLREQPI